MKKVLALVLSLMLLLGTFAFAEGDYSGTITISVYSSTGVDEAWAAVGKAYEALNPGVKVVVDLKPSDSYSDWVKAMFQSYEDTTPEADIVFGNLAGNDRMDKVINFLDYLGEESPYSDCEDWTEQFAFEMQNIEQGGTLWDCVNGTGEKPKSCASSTVTAARNRITVMLSINIARTKDSAINEIKIGIVR